MVQQEILRKNVVSGQGELAFRTIIALGIPHFYPLATLVYVIVQLY